MSPNVYNDLELEREQEWAYGNPALGCGLSGAQPPFPQRGEGRSAFKPAIEPPFRWSHCAAKSDGKQLRVVKLTDYTAEKVRTLRTGPEDLRTVVNQLQELLYAP